jgi:MHS family alpha-ketoglutarate permease-like MFS transporter
MSVRGHYGFYSSFQYSTLIMGQLMALALLTVFQQFLLTPAQLTDWGWRIPFLLGAVWAVIDPYIRRDMDETKAFLERNRSARRLSSNLAMLARYPREVVVVLGLTVGGTIAFYTFAVYSQDFLVNTAGFSNATSTLIITGTLFISMLLQPVFGALSDRVGRRPVLIGFGVLCTFGTIPVMHILATVTNPWIAFGLITAAMASISLYTSVSAAVRAELFPTEIRVLGSGFPYAVAVSVFGGTAEYIALWLKSIVREPWFYVYVTFCGALSLLTYLWMPETSRQSRLVT